MIREIQRELGSSILFVTHDMAVHANLTDRLGIMYAGRLVEEGRTADIFRTPRHPYTAHLIASLPRLGDIGAQGGALAARRPTSPIRRPAAASIRAARAPPTSAAARCRRWSRWRPAIASPASIRSRRMRDRAARARATSAAATAAACSRAGRSMAVSDVSLRLEAGAAGDLHRRGRVGQRQDHARPHDPGHGARRARARSASRAPTSRRIRGTRARLAFMRKVQPIFQNPFEAFNPMKRVDRYLFATARRMADVVGEAAIAEAADAALQERRPVARRDPRPLPAPALGRPAPAGRHRPRPDLQARCCWWPTSRCR